MSSQGKRQDNSQNPTAEQELVQDEKKKKIKRLNSENKRSNSNAQNNKKVDIWHRNEMEKMRKLQEANQKRLKENTLKEKNEQSKAEREQQEILENLKKEKKEQYEKYLRTNIRQNEQNYQKQKPIANVYRNIDIIQGIGAENNQYSKENYLDPQQGQSKKGLKQWVPKPVPLEDAERHLREQKIEQELYENQMRQVELERMLEDKKMLDMYKNIPKPKNHQQNQKQRGEQNTIHEDDEHSGSFSVERESNLYIDSENESQVRKKRKKNEYPPKQSKSSQQNKEKNQKMRNSDLQQSGDHNPYNQEFSIVEDQYDFHGEDRNKTPDMLGFEAYNHQVKVKVQNEQPKKKTIEIEQKNNKERQGSYGQEKQGSPPQQTQKKKGWDLKSKEMKKDHDNQEWNFDDEGEENKKENLKKESFVQKVLPNGMTNHHKEVVLSKEFQKIKFDIGREEDEEDSRNTNKQRAASIQPYQKVSSDQIYKSHEEDKANKYSDIKKQLDEKEINLLKHKQEELIKQKREQREKEKDMEKQKQQYLKEYKNTSGQKDKTNSNFNYDDDENKESILQEFKHQFNDLKKQYNQHRKSINQASKPNLPTAAEPQQKDSKNLQQNKKKDQVSQNKNHQTNVQTEYANQLKSPYQDEMLEQDEYDDDQQVQQKSLNQSGKIVRRTNYLKDVSKFSSKSQAPIEQPSYSKNQKERRKFWERKTNEDFLNQSISEKATITAISKFKSKLQSNINQDKKLNNETILSPKTSQKKKEMEEWQKMNDQEIKLQREILNIHMDNLDKVKEVEEKNLINTSQNLSQNLSQLVENKSKSRINTAVSTKSNATTKTNKTNKTNKTSIHKDITGKNNMKQINPISEIENEDDIEASLMNIDNKLINQKNRIDLMTAEIEQSSKPKHPELRKELLKNPSMLKTNPFTVDITSIDKEYLEDEKQKYISPIVNNKKQSKLNISHVSHISASKEIMSNRPTSNKTNITQNQLNSLAKILPPSIHQQNNISHSHSNLPSDKLPKILQHNGQTLEPITQDKQRHETSKQQITTTYSQNSNPNFPKQNQSQHSVLSPPVAKSQQIQQNILQKKQSESKELNSQQRQKEMELKKRFPEFFVDEAVQPQQGETTPVMARHKQRDQESSSSVSSHRLNEKKYLNPIERDDNLNQVMQSYNVQTAVASQQPKRQESSKSLNKKKQPQQELPSVNKQVVENDKEDLKLWWKSVQKSVERQYDNTPSSSIHRAEEEESQKFSNKINQQAILNKEEQQSYTPQNNKNKVDDQSPNENKEYLKKNKPTKLEEDSKEIQESAQNEALSKEERKKLIMKKFMEECEEEEEQDQHQQETEKTPVRNIKSGNKVDGQQIQNKDSNGQNRKQLVEIKFGQQNEINQKQPRRIQNEDGIEINESEIMSDNPSVVSKKNNGVNEYSKNRKEIRNLSGHERSKETHSQHNKKSRQKSAESTNSDSRNQLRSQANEKQSSNQSSPTNPNKKRVERVLDQNLLVKVEFSQQKIEETIQKTLEKLEQAEQEQLKKEKDHKVSITKRKSDLSSQNSQHENELSEISQNYSFAESDFSKITGNGQYATRQIVKKNYIVTGKVPSRYNHENLYPPKNKSQNNSYMENPSNISSSKIQYINNESHQNNNNPSIVSNNKQPMSENREIIDEEEYQGDIKINKNVNLQKLLFVE